MADLIYKDIPITGNIPINDTRTSLLETWSSKKISDEIEESAESIENRMNVLGSKNVLPFDPMLSFGSLSLTCTKQANGTARYNGSTSGVIWFGISEPGYEPTKGRTLLTKGTYTIFVKSNQELNANTTVSLLTSPETEYLAAFSSGTNNKRTFTLSQDTYVYFGVRFNNITVNNFDVQAYITLASDPDDTYTPYAMTNRQLTENGFMIRRVLSNADNLDNVKTVGMYSITTVPVNAPAGTQYCSLLVMPMSAELDGSKGLIQAIFTGSTMLLRRYAGSPLQWDNWFKVTGTVVS